MTTHPDKSAVEVLREAVIQSLRFADHAAGEGLFFPSVDEAELDPATFLLPAYNLLDTDDLPTLIDRISAFFSGTTAGQADEVAELRAELARKEEWNRLRAEDIMTLGQQVAAAEARATTAEAALAASQAEVERLREALHRRDGPAARAVRKVLAAAGASEFSVASVIRRVQSDDPEVTRKEVWSVIANLKRRGSLDQIRYGVYRASLQAKGGVDA